MSQQWHYLDSQNTEFGPFDSQRMRGWYEQGYFSVAGDNLLVRLASWKEFKPISQLYGGDKAAYFNSPPRTPDGEESGGRDRHRSRSRGRRRDSREGGRDGGRDASTPAAQPTPAGYPPSGYPPSPSGYPPSGYPPYGAYGAYQGAPPGPWGAPPPPGGAYGGAWGHPPPFMPPHGAPRPPYGAYWPPPPGAYGGYWPPPPGGPYGAPPLPALRDSRSPSRRRSPPRQQRRRSRSRDDEKARKAREEEQQMRELGRDGLRNMLTGTLESLYKDRIRPMANYVKGRLKERSCPEVVIRQYLELFGQHSDLFRLEKQADSDESAVLFVTEPDWFKGWVDLESLDDPYDEDMWKDLKDFLEEGAHAFAGGRYGMARELVSRNLTFLAPYSLGEICHIVQLAIQHRKIIAYHKKMLKPMQSCGTVLATTPATNGDGKAGDNLEEIGDLLELCRVLFKTLRKHSTGIRLDRMKQMIKEECSCRLNEMAFKCTKLTELFRQEPLKSTFTLENDGKAFYVRAMEPRSFPEDVRRVHDEVNLAGAGG